MKAFAAFLCLMLAGCELRTHEVRLIRPDGTLHSTFFVQSYIPSGPQVAPRDGCLILRSWSGSYAAPSGWMFDISQPPAEAR